MDLAKHISYHLSNDYSDKTFGTNYSNSNNIFDKLVIDIETYFTRPVTTIKDLKDRESKRQKGLVWEQFCLLWLRAHDQYLNVWTWAETPSEILRYFGITQRMDNGIDLVLQTSTGYIAIQCKYRKKGAVQWKTLSTFVGLCAASNKWQQHWVMTNASSVNRKIIKSAKDKSLCVGTFRNTDRTIWLKMANLYREKSNSL